LGLIVAAASFILAGAAVSKVTIRTVRMMRALSFGPISDGDGQFLPVLDGAAKEGLVGGKADGAEG